MEFLREKVDLRYWSEIGREAGMDRSEESAETLRVDMEVSPFLSTLRAVGVSTIAEVQSLIDELEAKRSTVLEWLRKFLDG
jgi:hypothetical protein